MPNSWLLAHAQTTLLLTAKNSCVGKRNCCGPGWVKTKQNARIYDLWRRHGTATPPFKKEKSNFTIGWGIFEGGNLPWTISTLASSRPYVRLVLFASLWPTAWISGSNWCPLEMSDRWCFLLLIEIAMLKIGMRMIVLARKLGTIASLFLISNWPPPPMKGKNTGTFRPLNIRWPHNL